MSDSSNVLYNSAFLAVLCAKVANIDLKMLQIVCIIKVLPVVSVFGHSGIYAARRVDFKRTALCRKKRVEITVCLPNIRKDDE